MIKVGGGKYQFPPPRCRLRVRHRRRFLCGKAWRFYVLWFGAAIGNPGNPLHGMSVRKVPMSAERTGGRWVICRYIVKKGRTIYPKNGKCFRFWVDDSKRK